MGVAIQTLQELFDGCIRLGDLTYERLEGGVRGFNYLLSFYKRVKR